MSDASLHRFITEPKVEFVTNSYRQAVTQVANESRLTDCEQAEKYWQEYSRKWQTSQELFEAGKLHLHEAFIEFSEWRNEGAKEFAEVETLKMGLVHMIAETLDKLGKKVLIRGHWGVLAAEIAVRIFIEVYPHARDFNQAMRDSRKMTDAAHKLAQESIKALVNSLDLEAACQKEAEKARTEEQFLDEAKKLRDSWELEGSVLFRDPNDPAQNLLDAAAALKRAKEVLRPQKQLSSPNDSPTSVPTKSSTMQQTSTSPTDTTNEDTIVTVEQLREALSEVDKALAELTKAQKSLNAENAFARKIEGTLEDIIETWKKAASMRGAAMVS